MSLVDKRLLRQRAIIGSINGRLKHIQQIEHTRHRMGSWPKRIFDPFPSWRNS
ncbi:MAG TPA: transposase [Candidatus Competibacteraceae bacterium]|nr:transposase [Candidatus Competibacteraceae bacterium]